MTARLLVGDVREVLAGLPERSAHVCVTSPPYFGLRSYLGNSHVDKHREIGSESSLDAYIATMVEVFRLVRRVLRDDGSLWLNVGDSFASKPVGSFNGGGFKDKSASNGTRNLSGVATSGMMDKVAASGLKPKDLMMVPARVALALQADGWYLRSDIIWAKRAPMPESVTDRPTSAHEHVFLLTKQARYFYDAEAVKEASSWGRENNPEWQYQRAETNAKKGCGNRNAQSGGFTAWSPDQGRNMRNVWTLGPESFAQAHFAVFPTEIPRRAILAGTSERGCCPACGAPYRRIIEREKPPDSAFNTARFVADERVKMSPLHRSGKASGQKMQNWLDEHPTKTIGWQPSCTCNAGPPIPCTVLDIFGGSGTTSLVADRLGRDSIYIDLSAEYAAMAKARIAGDCPMFAQVVTP